LQVLLQKFEEEMSKPDVYADVDKLMEINQKYESGKKEKQELEQEWDSIVSELSEYQ
jgi:hypothetical protein